MRTSPSRVRVVLLATVVWALAASSPASAQDVYYLRTGGILSPAAPDAGAVTAVNSETIPAGEDALLGSFSSSPVQQEVVLGQVRGIAWLGTGRPGMDGCARVTMSLMRLTGSSQTVVATGTLDTSIRPRRNLLEPIIVPMLLTGDPLVAATGDRLIFDVHVTNQCGGERRVVLLYDSVGRASAVELYAPGQTTSTTTTTTGVDPTSTTTSTLPPTCLDTATGLAAVRCRLETMDGIIRTTSPASLGGRRFHGKLARRVEKALRFVRAAEVIEATPRRLRRGRKQITKFVNLLGRGQADGRVAREVGDPLLSLANGALGRLDTVATGG